MVAVEKLRRGNRARAGATRPAGAADDGCDASGGITDQRSGDGQFDVLEFVVNGLIADRELVFQFAVGGVDGRLSGR